MRTAFRLAAALLFVTAVAVPAQLVFEPPVVTSMPGAIFNTNRVLGDIDEDGDLDVMTVVGDFGSSEVRYFLNDGTGALVEAPFFNTTPSPRGVALIDLDGDEHLDLVVLAGSSVVVHPGNGDGTFGLLTGFAVTSAASHFAIGLVNDDELLDFVVATYEVPIFFPPRLEVYLGAGGMTWVAERSEILASEVADMELVDVTGDSELDVVLIRAGVAEVRPGDGLGSFGAAQPIAGTIFTSRMTSGDLDDDDDVDLVLGSLSPEVQTVLNDGVGNFSAAQTFPVGFLGANPGLGDMDDDGVLDIVLNDSGADFMGELVVLRGQGGGAFAQNVAVTASVFAGGGSIAVGDMDDDGLLDAVTGSGGVSVFRNHTYLPGSPFLDHGHALPGTNGYPVQLASGSLLAGEPFAFQLVNGLPRGLATIVLGASQADLPFKGGTMVPFPDLLLFGNPMGPDGAAGVAGNWTPGIPSGITLWLQWWFADEGGVAGKAASSGLSLTTP